MKREIDPLKIGRLNRIVIIILACVNVGSLFFVIAHLLKFFSLSIKFVGFFELIVFAISAVLYKFCRLTEIAYRLVSEKTKLLETTQIRLMDFVPRILDSHEIFTGHHVRHTVVYVEMICHELVRRGVYADILTPEKIQLYSVAANLHDIGKVHIPDSILNKNGPFTPAEYEMMKNHPVEGRDLVDCMPVIGDGEFNIVAMQMAYFHHENYDGTGYPNGIAGDKIPLCARIMACADVLDALISVRPYKKSFTIEETMEIFRKSKGTHFEPCIADAVLALKDEIITVSQKFKISEQEQEERELEWRRKLKEVAGIEEVQDVEELEEIQDAESVE